MRSERHEGFTLSGLPVVTAIIGSDVAMPLASFRNSEKLDIDRIGGAFSRPVSMTGLIAPPSA